MEPELTSDEHRIRIGLVLRQLRGDDLRADEMKALAEFNRRVDRARTRGRSMDPTADPC